ncbi:hypothetical protein B0H14DRAFT_3430634 [Mycena olivaceomarginata]|nr:hypothetical protein B0H14DRAFT_3430634 [Mycena olivaceomarginata]
MASSGRRTHRKRISALRLSSDTTNTLPEYIGWRDLVPPPKYDSEEGADADADDDTDDPDDHADLTVVSRPTYISPPVSPRLQHQQQRRSHRRRVSSPLQQTDVLLDSLLERSVHALELSNALLQSSMSPTTAAIESEAEPEPPRAASATMAVPVRRSVMPPREHARDAEPAWADDLAAIARDVDELLVSSSLPASVSPVSTRRPQRRPSLDRAAPSGSGSTSSTAYLSPRSASPTASTTSYTSRSTSHSHSTSTSHTSHASTGSTSTAGLRIAPAARQRLVAPAPRALTQYVDASLDPQHAHLHDEEDQHIALPSTIGLRAPGSEWAGPGPAFDVRHRERDGEGDGGYEGRYTALPGRTRDRERMGEWGRGHERERTIRPPPPPVVEGLPPLSSADAFTFPRPHGLASSHSTHSSRSYSSRETQRESRASPLRDGRDREREPRHQPHALREEPRRARDEPTDEWVTVGARDWAPDAAAALRSAVGASFSSASASASNSASASAFNTATSKRGTGTSSAGSSISRASAGAGLQRAASVGATPVAKSTTSKFAPSLPNIAGSLPSLPSALAGLLRRDSAQPSSNSNSNFTSSVKAAQGTRRSSSPRSAGSGGSRRGRSESRNGRSGSGGGSGTPRASGGSGISYSTPDLRLIATSLPSESRTSSESSGSWGEEGEEGCGGAHGGEREGRQGGCRAKEARSALRKILDEAPKPPPPPAPPRRQFLPRSPPPLPHIAPSTATASVSRLFSKGGRHSVSSAQASQPVVGIMKGRSGRSVPGTPVTPMTPVGGAPGTPNEGEPSQLGPEAGPSSGSGGTHSRTPSVGGLTASTASFFNFGMRRSRPGSGASTPKRISFAELPESYTGSGSGSGKYAAAKRSRRAGAKGKGKARTKGKRGSEDGEGEGEGGRGRGVVGVDGARATEPPPTAGQDKDKADATSLYPLPSRLPSRTRMPSADEERSTHKART